MVSPQAATPCPLAPVVPRLGCVDVTVNISEWGEFDSIDTGALGVTGRDGYGQPTPTIRELTQILAALPEQFQDLPVGRYCDEGIRGLQYALHYPREDRTGIDSWTAHVRLW
jgi:hypothetical protein